MTPAQAKTAWMPFIHRSIHDYQQLVPEVRAEVLKMIAGRARGAPSQEAMRWWGGLPGLPQHNRLVFAAIKNGSAGKNTGAKILNFPHR